MKIQILWLHKTRGFFFSFLTTTTKRRNENQENLGKVENVAKKRRLAAGQRSSHLITCWPRSWPCIEAKRTRETRKRRKEREIEFGITYASCRGGGEGNNMGSGIRNTAEDAPIEIERDGGGFLFFSPLQQDTPDSPKTRYPYCMCECVCCYTRMSHNISPKNPHFFFFYLFIYFITFCPSKCFLQILPPDTAGPCRSRKFLSAPFSLTHIQTVTDTHEKHLLFITV